MSTQSQSLETAQALLKKAAPSQGGRTLHEHLTDVLLTIAKEQPNDPLGSFEFISARVKQSHQWQQQQQSGGEVPVLLAQTNSRKFLAGIDEAAKQKLLSSCAAVNKLVSPVPPGDGEEVPEAAVGFPNIIEQCQMLQWAGVSLSSEEAYLLGASLENLARNKKLSNVRLFGKIFGSQRDYIIAEAKFIEPPESEPAPENDTTPPAEKPEDAGAGCNEYVYFVTHSHSGEWTLLPNVTPKQIKIARKLRRGFVGDLTAAVPGYPRFPWPESAYLRAQIARIVASTVVEPKGLHTVNSEEEDSPPTLQEDEEFKGLPLSELSAGLDNWVHARPFVFKQGRAQKVNPPEPEEEQEESEEEKKVVKPNIVKTAEEVAEETAENEEEAVDLLRALSEDADDKAQPAWALRAWPLQGRGGAPNVSHGFVSLRSLLWPGAVAVAETDSKRNAVFYCGYGLKRLPVGKRYSPAPIPAVQPEYGHPLPQPAEDEEEKPVDPFAEQTDPLPPPPKPVEEEAQPVADGEEQEAQENEEEDS